MRNYGRYYSRVPRDREGMRSRSFPFAYWTTSTIHNPYETGTSPHSKHCIRRDQILRQGLKGAHEERRIRCMGTEGAVRKVLCTGNLA
jgi:hypothetical protein